MSEPGVGTVTVVLLVVVPLLAAAVVAGLGRWMSRSIADAFTAAVAAGCLIGSGYLLLARSSDRLVVWVGGYEPEKGTSVGIALVADRGADLLVVIAASLVLAAVVYSWGYLEDVHAAEHSLVLVFLSGMTGFAFAADLFNAFVWFELMSVAAFAMTGLRVEEPRSVHGALTFGAMTSWAATVSLLGIGLLYGLTGELNMASIGVELRGSGPSAAVNAACALVFVGYLVKAAAVPWHFWTADAEAVAPTPVCALLSGALVALGVYGVARAWWTMFDGVVGEATMRTTLLSLGCLTALVGAFMCTTQRHIKRLLAYSTISHVGVMLIAVGLLGDEGLAAAGLYAIGHACVKGSLFLGTGVLLNRFESVDEHALHGRGRDMPLTRWAFVVGALGLIGFPACGVWLGKSVLEHATAAETPDWFTAWVIVVLLTVSACTGGSVLRLTSRVFWGAGVPPPDAGRQDEEEPETDSVLQRSPLRMVGPCWALLLVGLAIALIPGLPTAAERGAAVFADPTGYANAVLGAGPVPPPPALTAASPWTTASVTFGLLATLLAVGMAAGWLWSPALGSRWRRRRRLLGRPVRALHALHAGHIGDYVAWAMLGSACIGVALVVAA